MLERMGHAMGHKRLNVEVVTAIDGPAGLVLVRLHKKADLPRDTGDVPPLAIYQDGALIIAADLRLYNRTELERQFGQQESDVHFIARLYDSEGARGLDKLEGDFTIALWDRRARKMLVKRDHVGVRPAYYAHEAGTGFAFASLGKGVRASGLIPAPIDRQAQLDHMSHDSSDLVSTFHHNLKRLPGGHEGVAGVGEFRISEYWHLKPQPYPSGDITFEDWVAELQRRFRVAVTKRLPEDGPIASHLSSGMDSASISAIAAENLKNDNQVLDAYTFGMSEEFTEEDMLDEVPYARKVAMARNRIAWNVLHVQRGRGNEPEEYEEDRDAPVHISGFEERAAHDASAKGSSVILSGWGGDEIATYTGTGALAEFLLQGKFSRFAREVKLYAKRRQESVSRVLYAVVGARFLPEPLLDMAKGLTGHRDFKGLRRQRSGFKEHIAKSYDKSYRRGPNTQKNRIRKFYRGNLHWRLEDWAYTGARYGVQYAFPMLDMALIEHCLACPPEFLLRDGYNRAGFRAAMEGVLPDEIRLNRWKHIATPCSNIETIRGKDKFLAQLAELEKDPELVEVFDFDGIRKRIHALPTEETERKRLARWARLGEQGYNLGSGIVRPIANMKRYQQLKRIERGEDE